MQDVIDAVIATEPTLTNLCAPFPLSGQKRVLKGTDSLLGEVVVKIVLCPDDPRAIQEIDIVTKHTFQNVPKIHRSGEIELGGQRHIYLIEPYIEGRTLQEVIDNGPLDPDDAKAVLSALLTTIAALEERRVVHRDIKPANIMMDDNGCTWLLDFGIARVLDRTVNLTESDGDGPHSPGYAPPEVYRNRQDLIDSRADLFSAAIVFHEIAEGSHPYGHPRADIRDAIESGHHDPLTVSGCVGEQLAQLVALMMSPHINFRPPDARTALNWYREAIAEESS